MKKKLFVVSDIHGHFSLMEDALKKAGFDKNNSEHLLICCGDYFDRGDENKKVLTFFERLRNCVLLRGNHEDMLSDIITSGKLLPHNIGNGTLTTLCEFFGERNVDADLFTLDTSSNTSTAERLLDFINSTKPYFETENYVFTHGWMPTEAVFEGFEVPENWRDASQKAWRDARWHKWLDYAKVTSFPEGKTIVCGHVPAFYARYVDSSRTEEDSSIFYGDGFIVVDAGTYSSQSVNVLVLEDNLI